MKGISAGSQLSQNDIQYYSVTLEFEFSRYKYNMPILDAGYYEFHSPLTEPERIRDKEGNEVSTPQLLDGSGSPLAQGGTPVFNDHDRYFESNFNTLGIILP